MVGVVHRVYMEKMLRESMEAIAVVHVVAIVAWRNVVYVVSYMWANEKLYVDVMVLKKIVMIV